MKFPRRGFLHLVAGAAVLPTISGIAKAQTYPTRPVRIIVGYPPGGITDFYARLSGQLLSERLGQPFIIENRTGAGGTIAVDSVVRAPPDGYTLLITSSNDIYNPSLYPDLKYEYFRDITPVAGVALSPLVLEVNPSIPINTVPELIGYAKANPGKAQLCFGRRRHGSTFMRRAIQNADGREHGSRAIPGRCSSGLRPDRRAGPGWV